METVNLNQLTLAEGNIFLLGGTPFSGFAIATFPDGRLRTQMLLMRGLEDGVTRCWHPNGQLKSDRSFRNGIAHGRHQEWRANGVLLTQSLWHAGEQVQEFSFDDQSRLTRRIDFLPPAEQPTTFAYDAEGRRTGHGAD